MQRWMLTAYCLIVKILQFCPIDGRVQQLVVFGWVGSIVQYILSWFMSHEIRQLRWDRAVWNHELV